MYQLQLLCSIMYSRLVKIDRNDLIGNGEHMEESYIFMFLVSMFKFLIGVPHRFFFVLKLIHYNLPT